jgi:hypothetical protein
MSFSFTFAKQIFSILCFSEPTIFEIVKGVVGYLNTKKYHRPFEVHLLMK